MRQKYSCIGEILSQRKERISLSQLILRKALKDIQTGIVLIFQKVRRRTFSMIGEMRQFSSCIGGYLKVFSISLFHYNKLKATSPETETEARRLFEMISTDSTTEKIVCILRFEKKNQRAETL